MEIPRALATSRAPPPLSTSTRRKVTSVASLAMRAREEDKVRHAESSKVTASSLMTHCSSDSMATITSLSPASESAASNSCVLWISRVRSMTRSDSFARRDWMESYCALTRNAVAARARVGFAPRRAARATGVAVKAEAERALIGTSDACVLVWRVRAISRGRKANNIAEKRFAESPYIFTSACV